MATNTAIINELAQIAGDPTFTKRSSTTWASILNDAQNYIVERIECSRKVDSTSVTLVASTQEYSLPTDFIKFPSDYLEVKKGPVALGTYGKFVLTPTDPILLNHNFPNWRATDAGTPEFYYIIKDTTYKIGFYPQPSATFISTNGSTVYIDEIFRPTAIAYNGVQPFGDSNHLAGFQFALKLRARYTVLLIDKDFPSADRLRLDTDKEIDEKGELLKSIILTPGEHGFANNFG